jgi:hypothetical protein
MDTRCVDPAAPARDWKQITAWLMFASTVLAAAFLIYVTFFPYVCYHAYGGSPTCAALFPLYVPFDDFLKAHADSIFSRGVWSYCHWVENHLYHLG